MKRLLPFWILFIACTFSSQVFAQEKTIVLTDSTTQIEGDVEVSDYLVPLYVPRKALMYAAILPGMGQAYNKKYWKMPIVYGGFIGLGYMISYYNENHARFKKELFSLLADPDYIPPSGAGESQLRGIVDLTRRERDYMIIITGGFYLIQIVDAHIDAHLREFDLNPDLQVKIEPSFQQAGNQNAIGLAIKLKF